MEEQHREEKVHPASEVRPASESAGRPWDDDEPIEDLPAPAWFRRTAPSDPFPACRALLGWPMNYPVGPDADLDDYEWAEVEPARFVYSEPELEGWEAIVRAVLAPFEGP